MGEAAAGRGEAATSLEEDAATGEGATASATAASQAASIQEQSPGHWARPWQCRCVTRRACRGNTE